MAPAETLDKRGVFASLWQRSIMLKRHRRLKKISALSTAATLISIPDSRSKRRSGPACARLQSAHLCSTQRFPSWPCQRPRMVTGQATAFATLSIIGRSALLGLAAMLTTILGASADTVDVTDQPGFNAAIQAAITTGQPNTINVTASTLVTADTGLVLPGQASPLNLNFVGSAPSFGVGSGSAGSLTIGTGTNIAFTPASSFALFRVGYGVGSSGTITMTGGTITGNQSITNYLSFSMGRNFGTGTFNQSGGTFSLDGGAFQVGVASGQGTYDLSGTGVVNMGTGGTIYLGDSAGGIGILNVSGNASFTSGSQMYVGNGTGAVGTITQNGPGSMVVLSGQNNFGVNSNDPPNPGGTGTYNLVNGSLVIANGAFANFGGIAGGTGILNQSGGALTTAGTGFVIIGQSGAGQYNMSGGTANFVAGLTMGLLAGSTGVVNQTGGTVTISGGVLRIGTTGTATYNLNGGVLQAGGANGIAGTGSLNLGGGALQVINSALTTNIAMRLTGTASTIDTNGLGATFGGVMSGAGGFSKLGAGTLSLTGANLYTGETTISAGTLQVGNGGTTGSVVGDVVDNAALVFDRSNASAFGGAVSGTGTLTKIGAGVLTLSGAGSYAGATSVNAGTLQAGAANVFSASSAYTIAAGATLNLGSFGNSIGSLAGGGVVTLGSATLTSGNDGTSTTFSGAISGTGGLTKVGGGALSLAGASAYSGPTNINAGILDVNGSLASAVFVDSGGTLMGGGAIGRLNVANGGTVAPGNSIGTLHVAGDIGFSSGSMYQVEVNAAGQSDLIAASGHATLTGGTVQVFGTLPLNLIYTILTAQGGVSGRFSNVLAPSFAFLTPELDYMPNSVSLSLRQSQSFASAAETPNQFNVATAVATLPRNSSLFGAIETQVSAAEARQAFDALSGEIHASTQTVMLDDSGNFRQAMLGRLRQAGFAGTTGPMSALGSGGPHVENAEPLGDFMARFDPAAAAFTYGDANGSAHPGKSLQSAVPNPEMTWWTQGVGAWGRIDDDGNAAAVSHNLGGFFTGVDRRLGDNWQAGIAGGYTNSGVSDYARASSANIDTTQFGAYTAANYGPWNLRAGAAVGWSTIDTNRTILFPGFSDRTSARYGATTVQLFNEVGYGMALSAIAAEPFAGLAWVYLDTNGFNETGATIAALDGSISRRDAGYSTLGVRLATSYVLPNGMLLTPRVSAAWQHAVGDVTPDAMFTFGGPSATFTVAGLPLARDAALLETGLDVLITPRARVGISYAGQLAQGVQDHSVKGNLLVRF